MSWGIFAYDADGDSGFGRIVGPFRSAERADTVADKLRAAAEKGSEPFGIDRLECIVVPMMPGTSHIQHVLAAIND